MSSVDAVLNGTYLQKLLQIFPDYNPEDFWALICCGSDLKHPYEGWAGVVSVPLFTDESPFELFFGDFNDALAEYENVPRYRISVDMSKQQAFSEYRAYMENVSDHPVLISANADRWCLPIITEAVRRDSAGPWNAQLICLRDLYSCCNAEMPLMHTEYVGEVFRAAPRLPIKFGLHAIADALKVKVPDSSNKAMHRARLTAESAASCLNSQYPLQ